MDPSTKTVAKGCFGKIYKQKYGDTWAAVKKVPMNFITKEQLTRECKVYEKAQHINVVKLLGTPWLEDGRWHIALEFVFGEDLETAIFKTQKSKIQLTASIKAVIITGMCEGLNFLHSKDIVHQDLKPDNIVIEQRTHRAVIIDMGLAKFFKNGLSSAVNLGNEAYAAPEIWQGHIRDKRSDVWAMGKIIAELCARIRLPTHSVTAFKIKETLGDHPYSSVAAKMVYVNASERATMCGIIGDIRLIASNYGVNFGQTHRANHGANHGVNHGLNHGSNHGANSGSNHGANYGAGAGKPHACLGNQMGSWEKGSSELGAKQKWYPPTPFPPEARHHEHHVEQIPRSQSPLPNSLVPGNVSNKLSEMDIPCALPSDGKVVHRCFDDETGQMEIKQIVTRCGKVVKYEDVKISKCCLKDLQDSHD